MSMHISPFEFKDFTGSLVANANAGSASTHFLSQEADKTMEDETPPEPSFTEAELETAKREARQAGYLEGMEEGRKVTQSEQADIERQLSEGLQQFVDAVQPVFMHYSQIAEKTQATMPQMALAIAQKIAGAALEHNSQEQVTQLVMQYVKLIEEKPNLTIAVEQRCVKLLEEKLAALAPNAESSPAITVREDANLAAGDFRISWADGLMQRDTASIMQQLTEKIDAMSLSAAHEVQQTMQTITPSTQQES